MINILWVVSLRVNCPSACMIDALIGITALIDMRDSVGFWRNTFQCLSILTISRYFHSMNVAANHNLSYIITTIHLTKSTLSYIHLRSYPIVSYPIISCTIISYAILSYDIICYHILFFPIISYPIISYSSLSYPLLSYPIIPYHILCYHILSCPILSYDIISHAILSYHMISYAML